MDVDCEQALPLRESREATREQHAKEHAIVRGGEREEEFLPCTVWIFPISFSAVFLKVRQKFMAGQPGARVKSIIINCG